MNILRREYLLDSLLFLVAMVIYAPSLSCGFVGDDLIYFIGNKFIRSFDVWTILRSGAIGADYLPLRDISFAFDYLMWGENPFGFHLTSVLLFGVIIVTVRHFFVSLNCFLCGRGADNNTINLSFLIAITIAVHPNHTEVVYAVFNRGALLTVLFSIVSTNLFIKYLSSHNYSRYLFYAGSIIFYVFALLSREYSLTIPFLFAMLIVYNKYNVSTKRGENSELLALLPFFIILETFFNIYKKYAVAAKFISEDTSLLSDVLSKASLAIKIVLFYLVRMVTSLGDFNFDDSSGLTFLSVVAISVCLIVGVWKRKQFPQILFGQIFYLTCLLPVLNLYKTLPIVSPRYSFLSCIGLFFIMMALPMAGRLKFIPIMCAVAVFVWSMTVMYKTNYWKDNVSFWEFWAARDNSQLAVSQLGYAYYDGKLYVKACETLRMLQPVPTDPKYFEVLGNSCFEIGKYQCALQAYESLLAFDARRGFALSQLTKMFQQLGDDSNSERYSEMYRVYESQLNENHLKAAP